MTLIQQLVQLNTLSTCQLLEIFADKFPEGIRGSLRDREASDVWYLIDLLVEEAHYTDTRLSGAVVDLVKAFNRFPRHVVMETARAVGIPDEFVTRWEKLLSKLRRCHKQGAEVGEPHGSTTGLPEGCGHSVVGMVLLCLVIDSVAQVGGSGYRIPVFCGQLGAPERDGSRTTQSFGLAR